MTKDNPIETLKALRDAGKKATKDKWVTSGNCIKAPGSDITNLAVVQYSLDMAFITQAANAREALSAVLDALEPIEGLDEAFAANGVVRLPNDIEFEKLVAIVEAARRYHKLCGGV